MGAVRSGRPNGRAMTAPGAGKHPRGIAGSSFRPFVQNSSLLPSVEVWTVSQFSLLPFGRPTMCVHAQARALVRYTGLPDFSVLACVLSRLSITRCECVWWMVPQVLRCCLPHAPSSMRRPGLYSSPMDLRRVALWGVPRSMVPQVLRCCLPHAPSNMRHPGL